MKIAIIETGEPPAPLNSKFPSYPEMFAIMLAGHDNFSFMPIAVSNGAPVPAVASFDGMIITGSPAGVYEGHDWIAPLETLIRTTAAAGKPQIGICFGHQIMAQAFDGTVEKTDKGWGVGVHDYQIHSKPDWMTPSPTRIRCAVSHQDQVIDPPVGATILAGSSFCEHGALAYAQGPAISFQMHPEFSHDFASNLLEIRRNRIPAPIVEEGLSSLKENSDRALLATWIANYFNSHRS